MSPKTSTAEKPVQVPEGSRVVLMVSRGTRPTPPAQVIEVPDVTSMAERSAEGELWSNGFRARIVEDHNPIFARGVVMGQMPEPGEMVAAGSDVVLLASLGKASAHLMKTELPDVVGKNEAEAIKELSRAGLKTQLVREYDEEAPPGTVVGQLPYRDWLAGLPPQKSNWGSWVVVAVALIALAIVVFVLLR